MGFYSMPTLSEDIVRIAAAYGLKLPVVESIELTGRQLQQLLVFLMEKGVPVA